jgi:hypothetical protein
LDITSELNTGVNTIEYYAVDYYGNEWGNTNGNKEGEYTIIKK